MLAVEEAHLTALAAGKGLFVSRAVSSGEILLQVSASVSISIVVSRLLHYLAGRLTHAVCVTWFQ